MKTSTNSLIILTAGGTGGHIYPAESLAVELLHRGFQVAFYTDSRGLSNYQGILKDLPTTSILSGSVVGKSFATKILSLSKVALGVCQAIYYMLRHRPRAVVGFGGYASFPTALAAVCLRIPLVIHEQNSVMSRTNRLLARFATRTAQSFRNARNTPVQAKQFLSGMPIRANIVQLYSHLYTPHDDKFNLLILGGSQGAKIFAEVIPQAIAMFDCEIQKKLHIIQQCRKGDEEILQKTYQSMACTTTISPFFTDMFQLYTQTDLMITRAGASSVYEIAAAGIPSIMVPLPTAADNHQYYNAKELSDHGGTILIEQKDLTAELLHRQIATLIADKQKLCELSINAKKCAIIDAPTRLADEIIKLI